jgi:hypothetical protein
LRSSVSLLAHDARARLVHLREQKPAQHRPNLRRLLTIIMIGLAVENVVFRVIEKNTVQRWGTQS